MSTSPEETALLLLWTARTWLSISAVFCMKAGATGSTPFKALRRIALEAAKAGVSKLIHVSAIGADARSASHYARSKAAGEAAVKNAFPAATILRPSIVFGPDDDFFNRFGAMAEAFSFLPLVGGGKTKFQPIYVDDVARYAFGPHVNAAEGKLYELGGPALQLPATYGPCGNPNSP